MSTTKEDIYVHNVYIEPTAYSIRDIPPILCDLKRLLELEGRYIILGDFNYHHLL